MSSKITSKSSIRVQWKDKIENFSKEKIKDIKNRLKHKYGVSNVRVDFYATNKLNIGLTNFDSDDIENINRPETQEKIILQYINDNNLDITVDDIKRLNKRVESNMDGFSDAKDNRWKIKNLQVENFLSFKNKVNLDFESLKGLTLIQGENFSGKTSLIIDSLRFLLFNTTSKTNTADEVINHFVNPDFASVEAELVIDNVDYKIERRVERSWKKDRSSYKTSTVLNFFMRNDAGEYENIKGDQRQTTEKIIQENIGGEKEFLMTVLCTGTNLFDIIEAKNTERGKLLTKFLGLEIFERKEEVSKKMYADWKIKSKIDKYSSTELQGIIENNEKIVIDTEGKIAIVRDLQEKIVKEKQLLILDKEALLKLYYRDIDGAHANLTEQYFINKIDQIKGTIVAKNKELSENKLLLSNEVLKYDVADYNIIKNEITSCEREISNEQIAVSLGEMQLESLRKKVSDLKNGEKCPTCGQSLKDVDHTNEINATIELGKVEKGKVEAAKICLADFKTKLVGIKEKLSELDKIKDKIARQELLQMKLDKLEVEIETFDMKIEKEEANRQRFLADLDKIEKNKEVDIKVRAKEIELTDATNREYQKNREIQQLENTIINSNKIINDNKVLIETIKKEEHIAKVFINYINMMGKNGISKTIIKNTVPVLNLELTKLLIDVAEFTISIEINEKNNEVEFWMIDNETDIKKPLSSGSGYERTIGALALRIVNSKVNTLPKPSLLLMDEVFGTVSATNLELVKGFIDKVSHEIDNIFIITHNEIVKEWADNIITVIKQNKVSTIH